jgi:acyl carrier protein
MAEVSLEDLKQLLVENCMLKVGPEAIGEDTPLFGPDSLGLDSIDALQVTLAVEKKYGVPMRDPETARQVLSSLGSLREWLVRQTP